MNKHLVLKEWVESFLGGYMYFENIDMTPGARSLVPQYGDYELRKDVLGNKYKEYAFAFTASEILDEIDNVENNANTRQLVDDFNDWLQEQQDTGNFPDFGENTFDYEIFPLQNTANMAGVYEEQGQRVAKYILSCRIEYVEKE